MGRRKRRRHRKRRRGPRGFSDRPWKWPYRLLCSAANIRGPEKRHVLNYFAFCISVSVAIGAGLGGGAIVASLLGLGVVGGALAGLVIAFLAFDLTAEWMARDRFYRP